MRGRRVIPRRGLLVLLRRRRALRRGIRRILVVTVLLEIDVSAETELLSRNADRVGIGFLRRIVICVHAVLFLCHILRAADTRYRSLPFVTALDIKGDRHHTRDLVICSWYKLDICKLSLPAERSEDLCEAFDAPHGIDIGHPFQTSGRDRLARFLRHFPQKVINRKILFVHRSLLLCCFPPPGGQDRHNPRV